MSSSPDHSSPVGELLRALAPAEREVIDRWWRAANYLSVGQIYLLANPLRREPLLPAHSHACSVLGYHSGPEPDLRPLEPGDTQTVT